MSQPLKIDFISDVVCPWCAIGYYRFQKAIEELNLQQQVSIEFQPFELNPNMPPEGENLRQHLANKYGTSKQESIAAREKLTSLGQEVGFEFNYFDQMKMVNTRKAHILIEYAKTLGHHQALKQALLSAFFSQQQDISSDEVLLSICLDLSIELPNGLEAILHDKELEKQVSKRESLWRELGVYSVPTIVFNDKEAVTGAQSVDTYKQILREFIPA